MNEFKPKRTVRYLYGIRKMQPFQQELLLLKKYLYTKNHTHFRYLTSLFTCICGLYGKWTPHFPYYNFAPC